MGRAFFSLSFQLLEMESISGIKLRGPFSSFGIFWGEDLMAYYSPVRVSQYPTCKHNLAQSLITVFGRSFQLITYLMDNAWMNDG